MYRVTAEDDLNGIEQKDFRSKPLAQAFLLELINRRLNECANNQVRYNFYQY